MTLAEMRTCDREFLVPEEVSEVIGCMPYTINVQAKENPEKLGFAVSIMGSRVKIPRRAFLHWLQYGNAPIEREKEVETDV